MRMSHGRSGRPSRLAQRALEVAVGLEERLLGEVLGIMVVADTVEAVGVDVAQVLAVELAEAPVQLLLARRYVRDPRHGAYWSGARLRRHAAVSPHGLRVRSSSTPAEPRPLQLTTRPDALGDDRRRLPAARHPTSRETAAASGPHAHLVRTQPPAPADRVGADHRDRDRPGRRSRAPAGRRRASGWPSGPGGCGALGEDQHDLAAGEQLLGGLDRVAVAVATVDRECAERASAASCSTGWSSNSSRLAT